MTEKEALDNIISYYTMTRSSSNVSENLQKIFEESLLVLQKNISTNPAKPEEEKTGG